MRPKLTQHGPLAIVGGRHPLLEQQLDCDYQPNDTYLAGAIYLNSLCECCTCNCV